MAPSLTSRYRAWLRTEFARKPDLEDYRSLLTFSRPAMIVTYAPLITAFTTVSSTSPQMTIWFIASAVLGGLLYHRAIQFDPVRFSRVSPRFKRWIAAFVTLAALPWVALPWVIGAAPDSTQFDAIFGSIACGAISWGGVFMTGRVKHISLTFSSVIIISVIAASFYYSGFEGQTLVPFVLVTHVILTMFGMNAATISRERDQAFEKLEASEKTAMQIAYIDPVTQLKNRTAFNRDLAELEAGPSTPGEGFTLAILDLDLFKNINDAHGHHMGDRVLEKTAQRIAYALPKFWKCYRMGGDEFALLAASGNVDGHKHSLTAMAKAVSRPIMVDRVRLEITATIGFARSPVHTISGETVLNAAEIALRDAKKTSVGSVRSFDPSLARAHANVLEIEREIRHNIEAGLIDIHYQPQFCFQSGRLVGLEALARLQARDGTKLDTQTVFDVAELRGMSQLLSRSVFANVGADLPEIFRKTDTDTIVSINICPADLVTGSPLLEVLGRWKREGFPTHRIRIELTEDCVVGRGSTGAMNFLQDISALGYGLSLDDFGTGHASLATLRTLDIDELKVDRQFAANIGDKKNEGILSGIIDIAESMGITCVIEGVENEAHHAVLEAMNAQVGQGYYWSKPLPLDELIAAFLQELPIQRSLG